tara:strand:- start:1337 stop:1501 length:165 start_codon:yes stop_codon:yes gene_type:complete
MMIVITAIMGLLGIFCLNTWIAVRSINKMEIVLDFSVEDFVNEMYEGHRFGRDD